MVQCFHMTSLQYITAGLRGPAGTSLPAAGVAGVLTSRCIDESIQVLSFGPELTLTVKSSLQ